MKLEKLLRTLGTLLVIYPKSVLCYFTGGKIFDCTVVVRIQENNRPV